VVLKAFPWIALAGPGVGGLSRQDICSQNHGIPHIASAFVEPGLLSKAKRTVKKTEAKTKKDTR